jgi:hypothetical protein
MGSRAGQATIEFALTYAAITLPLTFGIIFTSQLLWVWHSIVEFTRDGARYAVTHCWDGSGQNVISYMQTHVPPTVDQGQFGPGGATIEVRYFSRNTESGLLEDFSCDAGTCSTACIPDMVTVQVTGYESGRVLRYLGVPPVPAPDFRTSLPMESAGCTSGSAECSQ